MFPRLRFVWVKITFNILVPCDQFHIVDILPHKMAGKLQMWRKAVFIPSKTCIFLLQLVATDKGGNGTSSMTKILVEVEDVNDNPPIVPGVYAFTTPRLSPVGREVGRIQAIDRDWTKKNSRLLYYLKDGGQGKFAVNISSGGALISSL